MSLLRSFGTSCLLLLMGTAFGCAQEAKVGAVISRTGATAPYGQAVAKGLDLALEEINAAGGFKGTPMQLIYRDDEGKPEVGVAAASELISTEDVSAIIGAVGSRVTIEIAKICEDKGVILLSPSASAPKLSEAGQYIFRNYPSDILEGTAVADFARAQGLRTVAIIAMDDIYGIGLTDVFGRQFESKSRKVVKTVLFDPADPSKLPEIVAEVKELAPDGIYLVAYLNEMVELLRLLDEAGVKSVRLATSAVTDALVERAGATAEKLVYPNPGFDTESSEPAVAEFVEAFRARYGEDPDIFAAHGYDALKLIWTAMVDSGHTRPDEIKSGLLRMDYKGAAGRTAFDERGDVVRYPKLFVIQDGSPVPFNEFEAAGGKLVDNGGRR